MRARIRETAEGIVTIAVATLLGLFLNGAFEVHTIWEPDRTLLWVLFVVASATGALFIILQVLRVVLAIMERRLRMVERAIVLDRTVGEIMVVEHAKALGMNDRLITRWMGTHNRLAGLHPRTRDPRGQDRPGAGRARGVRRGPPEHALRSGAWLMMPIYDGDQVALAAQAALRPPSEPEPERERMPRWVAAAGIGLGGTIGAGLCWLLIELLG